MQEAQDLALKNYQDNLSYFEQNHPKLHSKLLALEVVLEDGAFKQKYDLEYINDYFDVVDLASGSKLYADNSNKISNELINQISLNKDDQVFQSQRIFNYEENALEHIKKLNVDIKHSTTAEIADYYNKNIDKSMSMLLIDKFIFIGVGLGLHIDGIVKKYGLQSVLIIEDDIELFRLSLFTCNYKQALNGVSSFFSIAQNSEEFQFLFYAYYSQYFIHNMYLKFSIFSSSLEHKIQEIQQLLISRPEATYSIERLLMKNKKVINKLSENYNFLNISKKLNEDFFNDKPILILGAGPSLHNNLEWLKENHQNFVIITSLVSLKTLKKINIVPDILVQIDENVPLAHKALDHLGDLDFLKDTICIFSASVPEILFEKFDREKIFLHEDRTRYKLGESTSIVASVGESMYSVALAFNTTNIYVLGIDLSLADDGSSHSPDHFKPYDIDKNTNDVDKEQGYDLGRSIIKTKGNFRDEVSTTPVFFLSIPVFNSKTYSLKTQEQNVYNLSDGVYLENTISLQPTKCSLNNPINKKVLPQQLEDFFTSYSSKEFSQTQEVGIQNRVEHINRYKRLLEEFEAEPFSTVDIFLKNYTNIISKMLNSIHDDELKDIEYILYLSLAPFISDFFNTKELTNKKKHIKKIRKMFITQLRRVVEYYETSLEKLVS